MQDRVRVGTDEIVFRVTSAQSDGQLVAAEVAMPPGDGPPALHRHDDFEVYRVERVELTLYVEDEAGDIGRITAGAGAVVAIPGGRAHTVRNESGEAAGAFVIFAPGAAMEAFVREAGTLAEHGPPRPEDVMALAARHGTEMAGAPG